jgi:hypothetical protein
LYQLCALKVNDIENNGFSLDDAFAFFVEEGRSNVHVTIRGKA